MVFRIGTPFPIHHVPILVGARGQKQDLRPDSIGTLVFDAGLHVAIGDPAVEVPGDPNVRCIRIAEPHHHLAWFRGSRGFCVCCPGFEFGRWAGSQLDGGGRIVEGPIGSG